MKTLRAQGSVATASAAGGAKLALTKPVEVKVLAGLPGVAANSEAAMILGPTSLRVFAEQGHFDIARKRIISVSAGDERIETGGTAGRVARVLIPYGGGMVLGSMTHKKVQLLTVEYLDGAGQYHGAVFLVAGEDLSGLLEPLLVTTSGLAIPAPSAGVACPEMDTQMNTVRVEAISADLSSGFPAEDRALLYENLVKQLQGEKSIETVFRAGDHGAGAACAEFSVTVKAEAFKKGDQAVRASVGPLGHFIGTTKLSYHLTVEAHGGLLVLDKEMKTSEGSDTDSLNITRAISKAVAKNLKHTRKQERARQTV